jgi:hypothetical protein
MNVGTVSIGEVLNIVQQVLQQNKLLIEQNHQLSQQNLQQNQQQIQQQQEKIQQQQQQIQQQQQQIQQQQEQYEKHLKEIITSVSRLSISKRQRSDNKEDVDVDDDGGDGGGNSENIKRSRIYSNEIVDDNKKEDKVIEEDLVKELESENEVRNRKEILLSNEVLDVIVNKKEKKYVIEDLGCILIKRPEDEELFKSILIKDRSKRKIREIENNNIYNTYWNNNIESIQDVKDFINYVCNRERNNVIFKLSISFGYIIEILENDVYTYNVFNPTIVNSKEENATVVIRDKDFIIKREQFKDYAISRIHEINEYEYLHNSSSHYIAIHKCRIDSYLMNLGGAPDPIVHELIENHYAFSYTGEYKLY